MKRAALVTAFWLFRIFAIALLVMPGNAQPSMQRIHILERGVYRAETIQRRDAARDGGATNIVQNPQLISNTATILGAVGVRFGLRYTATVSNTELKLVIRFPPGGLRDPATQRITFQSEFTVVTSAGATNYWEYHFENDWEVAAGVWTFEFWYRDKKLAEQRFCVHEIGARLTPDVMTNCGLGLS
jgi:hypothetical protein